MFTNQRQNQLFHKKNHEHSNISDNIIFFINIIMSNIEILPRYLSLFILCPAIHLSFDLTFLTIHHLRIRQNWSLNFFTTLQSTHLVPFFSVVALFFPHFRVHSHTIHFYDNSIAFDKLFHHKYSWLIELLLFIVRHNAQCNSPITFLNLTIYPCHLRCALY